MKLHHFTLAVTLSLLSASCCWATILGHKGCDFFCPLDIAELCARNSQGQNKSFWDECDAERFNCLNKEDYKKVHDGFCPGESPFEDNTELPEGVVPFPDDFSVDPEDVLNSTVLPEDTSEAPEEAVTSTALPPDTTKAPEDVVKSPTIPENGTEVPKDVDTSPNVHTK